VKHITYFVPFLESISAPASISTNELADIELYFSAQLNPSIFENADLTWDLATGGENETFAVLYYLVSKADAVNVDHREAPGNSLAFQRLFQTPGNHVLRFLSVDRREIGGSIFEATLTSGSFSIQPEPRPGWKIETISINVLP